MSTELPVLTLGEYIVALIDALSDAHPSMLARMRVIVEARRAHIILDDEAVEVSFDQDGRLHVQPASGKHVISGMGATDTATVLKLLDGHLEVSGAVLGDRLRVYGKDDDIMRMFMAIGILLDASPRTPALQELAARFISDRRVRFASLASDFRHVSWYPFSPEPDELRLLKKLDLLPDETS